MQPALPTTGSTITQAIWPLCRVEGFLDRGNIVVRQRQRMLDRFFRHASRAGNAQGCDTGAGLDQQRVRMAVIAAFKFHEKFCGR